MKLYLTLFISLAIKVQAQELLDINFYLNHKQVSKSAKDFYNSKFKAVDNIKTFSIIDSLNTKNDLTRPFYIFLVSKIVGKADGALSEALAISCKELIESHPDYLINFLYTKNPIVENRFLDDWTKLIASEFMIDCEGKEKLCIAKSLGKSLSKVKTTNQSKLKAIYQKIENYCH